MPEGTEAPTGAVTTSTDDARRLGRLYARRDQLRSAVKNLTGERDTFKTQAEQLATKVAELEKKADTSAAARRVAELERQILERDHRAAFDRVARERGVREEALADAWQLSGYAPEGEPDDDAIGALVEEQRAVRGYLFAEPAKAEGTPPVKPGVGTGKGPKPPASAQILSADDPRNSDVKYQMLNFDKISQAASERMARGEI